MGHKATGKGGQNSLSPSVGWDRRERVTERKGDREKGQVPPADPTETREGAGTTTAGRLTKRGNVFSRAESNPALRAEPVHPPPATAPARAKKFPIFSHFQAPNPPDFRASRAEIRSPWGRGCGNSEVKVAEPSPRWLHPPLSPHVSPGCGCGCLRTLQHYITAGEPAGERRQQKCSSLGSQGRPK